MFIVYEYKSLVTFEQRESLVSGLQCMYIGGQKGRFRLWEGRGRRFRLREGRGGEKEEGEGREVRGRRRLK